MKKPLLITHIPLQSEISTSIYEAYLSKFNTSFEYLRLKNPNDFINDIKKIFPNLKKYHYHLNDYEYYILELNEEFHLLIENLKEYWEIFVYAKDYPTLFKIYETYLKYKEYNNDKTINYTKILLKGNNINNITYQKSLKDFKDITEDYYPFLNTDTLIEYFLKGNENILILAGKAGVGKSKFASLILKKILENEDFYKEDFNVKTSKDIHLLNMDEFWHSLKNTDLLILDDLDFLLGSRNETREDIEKNQFINKLLSFTDGIEKNKTKIIITTNQPIDEIDEAILRTGRLFDILNFRPLKYKEAKEIFNKFLPNENFDQVIKEYGKNTNNGILQSDLGSIISNYKIKNKIINKKDYLLEENISAIFKTKKKKAGLI